MSEEYEYIEEQMYKMALPYKKMRRKEELFNGIMAAVLLVLGYWLTFSSNRPVNAILKESLVVDVERQVFTMFPPFYWGSIVVAAGCVMITCGLVNLVTALINLKYELFICSRNLKLYEAVISDYRHIFRGILCFLLYLTSWDTFESLANQYFRLMARDFGNFNPMILQKPLLQFILVVGWVIGMWFFLLLIIDDNIISKPLNRISIVWGIAVLVGLVLNVSINWWYLLVCLVAILTYWVIERLIKRKSIKEIEDVAQILEELDIKF